MSDLADDIGFSGQSTLQVSPRATAMVRIELATVVKSRSRGGFLTSIAEIFWTAIGSVRCQGRAGQAGDMPGTDGDGRYIAT